MKKFLSILLALAVGFTFTFGSAMSAFAATPNKADADTAIATQVQASYETIDEAATKLVEKTFTYEDGYLVSAGDANALFTGDAAKGLVSKATIQKKVDELVSVAKTAVQTAAEEQYGTGPLVTPADDAAYDQSAINQAVLNVKNAGIAAANGINAAAVLGDVTSGAYAMTIITVEVVKDYEKIATDAITALEAKVDDYSDLAKDKMAVSTTDVETINVSLADVSGLSANSTPQAIVKGITSTQKAAISTAKATLGSSTDVLAFITAIGAYQTAAKLAEDFILGHKRTATENYYIAPVPTKADIASDTTVAAAKTQAISEVNSVMDTKILSVKNGLNSALIGYNEYASLTNAQAKDKANLEKAIANLDAQVAAAKEVYAARINAAKTVGAVDTAKTAAISAINAFATTWNTFKANDSTPAVETEELLISMTTILENIDTVKKEAAIIGEMKDVNGKPYVDADALADDLEKAIAALYAGESLSDALDMIGHSSQEVALLNAKLQYIDWIEGTDSGLEPKDSKGNTLTDPWNEADAVVAPTTTANIEPFTTTTYTVNISALYEEADAEALTALVEETKEAISTAASITDIKAIFAAANDKYEAIETTTQHAAKWANSGKVGAAYINAKYEKELAAYAQYFIGKIDTDKYPADVNTQNGVLSNVVYPIVYTAKTADELAAKVAEAKAAVDAIKSTDAIKAAAADVDALIAKINTPATLADKDAIIAAADAFADYKLIPGNEESYVTKRMVLNAAITAYEKADATAINDAYAVLAKKAVITTDDAEAIEALRAQFDAHNAFDEKYGVTTHNVTMSESNLAGLEEKLSNAKIKAVSELLTKLPAEVKATDKEQIEAARAAYEALTLEEKATVMDIADGVLYKNLLNAEADLAKVVKFTDADAKAYVQDLAIAVRTVKSGKKVKVTVNADVQTLLDNGFTVEYKFYKSTKKSSGYKNTVNKTTNTYTNTNPVKGKNYYKVKLVVKNADGEIVATTPLTQCKYGVRTMK